MSDMHRGPVNELGLARDRRAELGRQGGRSLGRLPGPDQLAERANPGRVIHVAVVTDSDGVPCPVGADYNTVKIGGLRFARDRMPELWAALGEAAWLAGTIEQQMRDEGALDDEDGDDGR